MRGFIPIGRIFGIPVGINPSWFLLLAFVVSNLATRVFPELLRGQPVWLLWLLSLVSVLVFFGSLVLHELGHSVVARYFRIPVRSITLFALGAVAQTTRESRRPGHEFLMAAAGPAVSILLAGVFMVPWFLTGMGDSVFSQVCGWLWIMNFFVGIFNLVPAFPMDGGRLLRSTLWAITGSYRRATRWASLIARGLAVLIVLVGVLGLLGWPEPLHEMHPLSALQLVLLGTFILFAARQGDAQSRVLDALSRLRVGDVMLRDVPVALTTTPVREALAGPLAGYGGGRHWLLVSDGDRFTGLAARAVLSAVPDERAGGITVGQVVFARERLQTAVPDEPLSEAMQRIDSEDLPALIVVDDGQVQGVVDRGVIAGALQAHPEFSSRTQ